MKHFVIFFIKKVNRGKMNSLKNREGESKNKCQIILKGSEMNPVSESSIIIDLESSLMTTFSSMFKSICVISQPFSSSNFGTPGDTNCD